MFKRILLVSVFAGSLFGVAPQVASAQRVALPAVAKSKVARKIRDKRIEKYRQHYLRKKAEGRATLMSPKKIKAEKEIQALALKLNKALKAKPPKKPVLIIFEGADGAGKSSTIRRIMPAFEGAVTVGSAHHGAPPKGADDVQDVLRYFGKVPTHGSVMIWDRSWYGRTKFARDNSLRKNTKDQKAAINDVRHIEGLLHDKVHIIKIDLDASIDRQAKTIGKREALAPEKLTDFDYMAYKQHDHMAKLSKNARKKTGKYVKWHVIPMNDRVAGRKQLLNTLHKELIGD